MNVSQEIPQGVLLAGSQQNRPQDSASLEGQSQEGLRVEFEWVKDRFAHRILAFVNGSWAPLLQSFEGDDENLWPPSPALQQLSIEPMPNDRRAALAVGMSGRSHYSISVDADQATPILNYDVACRYTEQPEFIGSSYRLLGETTHIDEHAIAMKVDENRQLHIKLTGDGDLQLALKIVGEQLQIQAPIAAAPATVRWQFQIELA